MNSNQTFYCLYAFLMRTISLLFADLCKISKLFYTKTTGKTTTLGPLYLIRVISTHLAHFQTNKISLPNPSAEFFHNFEVLVAFLIDYNLLTI